MLDLNDRGENVLSVIILIVVTLMMIYGAK